MKVIFISLFVIILDQLTKLMVKGFSIPFFDFHFKGMQIGERIKLFDNFFNITFVENPGIAFGIDFGGDYKLLISLFTIAASFAMLYYLYMNRNKSLFIRIPLAMIVGGAFGNLIDRVFYGLFYGYAPILFGKVVDFFEIKLFGFYLFNRTMGNYIFNFADMAVTFGVAFLLIAFHKERKRAQQKANEIAVSYEPILVENKD
ncbi:MAG: signal peptidase II [Ignavibacteriaceae bacterium]